MDELALNSYNRTITFLSVHSYNRIAATLQQIPMGEKTKESSELVHSTTSSVNLDLTHGLAGVELFSIRNNLINSQRQVR